MKKRRLDHIDLRVKDYHRARQFYSRILPALGFTCDRSDDTWSTFYAAGGDEVADFFGFTVDPQHKPNETRIAFWAESRKEVDELAEVVRAAGAQNIEGPELCQDYSPGYYAVFFEDSEGNKLEICFRESPVIEA
jgi:catechol 2,3-dioxygenase-like lactoylglutathione lyase family enzyme